jgi:hypothetical protein
LFCNILHRCFGVCNVPIVYVIQEDAAVHALIPALMAGQPHSTEAGSVEMELTLRASHIHPIFREDNEAVYHRLEEATRGTSYAALLKLYQCTKDGREVLFRLSSVSTPVKTNGNQNSRRMKACSTFKGGKDKATSHWRSTAHCTKVVSS